MKWSPQVSDSDCEWEHVCVCGQHRAQSERHTCLKTNGPLTFI